MYTFNVEFVEPLDKTLKYKLWIEINHKVLTTVRSLNVMFGFRLPQRAIESRELEVEHEDREAVNHQRSNSAAFIGNNICCCCSV